ncbi:MAG: hypothetical protein ACYC6T_07745 [Thermoleophilia bacterium]
MDGNERMALQLQGIEARMEFIGRQMRTLINIEITIAFVLVLWTLGVLGVLAFLFLGWRLP